MIQSKILKCGSVIRGSESMAEEEGYENTQKQMDCSGAGLPSGGISRVGTFYGMDGDDRLCSECEW